MTIERNGIEYELTRDELIKAYFEEQRNGYLDELNYWLNEAVENEDITEEQAKAVNLEDYVDDYKDKLDYHDGINERINIFTQDFINDYIIEDIKSEEEWS